MNEIKLNLRSKTNNSTPAKKEHCAYRGMKKERQRKREGKKQAVRKTNINRDKYHYAEFFSVYFATHNPFS